mmetsp:Transcript_110539/g.323406  ORF Transcript_110539/g.323406 Transcript_110539/m.323406 type:complete len:257 (-) Transcript_110539:103-873(-)
MAAYNPLAANEMLKDGSNPEGADPAPPLNWKGAKDFQDVALYGMHCSPPCCKMMAYLYKYNIPFKMVSGQSKPGSDYKKMPVLDVSGRQVNDSFIILKNLIPALTGGFDEEWEVLCSYQLAPSIEWTLSPADAAKWMSEPYGFGLPGCLLKCCLAKVLLENVVKKGIQKSLDTMPDKVKIIPLNDLGTKLRHRLAARNFSTGARPGQVDISFYGILAPFYYKECENVRSMVKDCGLQEWWNRMEKEIPMEKLFPPK